MNNKWFYSFLFVFFIPFSAYAVDQCNNTAECKNKFGSTATDCKDSKSDNSVCMCGSKACDTGTPSSTPASSKPASSKPASSVPASSTPASSKAASSTPSTSTGYYTKTGTDRTWAQILADKAIPINVNSTKGITSSTINVNNSVVEVGPYANREIPSAINIHTVGNSVIDRGDFAKWSRWYQEDGNTQVYF
jgi:hypothetical protein